MSQIKKHYNDYIDSHTGCPYQNDSATDKANWRRNQTDLLIKLLKERINEYNTKNKKFINLVYLQLVYIKMEMEK